MRSVPHYGRSSYPNAAMQVSNAVQTLPVKLTVCSPLSRPVSFTRYSHSLATTVPHIRQEDFQFPTALHKVRFWNLCLVYIASVTHHVTHYVAFQDGTCTKPNSLYSSLHDSTCITYHGMAPPHLDSWLTFLCSDWNCRSEFHKEGFLFI